MAGFVGTGISAVFPFTVVVTTRRAPRPRRSRCSRSRRRSRAARWPWTPWRRNSPSYQWMLERNDAGRRGDEPDPAAQRRGVRRRARYTCVATNADGIGDQQPGDRRHRSARRNIGRLVNISCRATVGTGGNILIAGFVVGGAGTSGEESLLIRGSGPALVPFGVTGTLPDPQLQLYSGSTAARKQRRLGRQRHRSRARRPPWARSRWSSPTSHDAALLRRPGRGRLHGADRRRERRHGRRPCRGLRRHAGGHVHADDPADRQHLGARPGGHGRQHPDRRLRDRRLARRGRSSSARRARRSSPSGSRARSRIPQLQLYSGSHRAREQQRLGRERADLERRGRRGGLRVELATSNDSAILVTLPPGRVHGPGVGRERRHRASRSSRSMRCRKALPAWALRLPGRVPRLARPRSRRCPCRIPQVPGFHFPESEATIVNWVYEMGNGAAGGRGDRVREHPRPRLGTLDGADHGDRPDRTTARSCACSRPGSRRRSCPAVPNTPRRRRAPGAVRGHARPCCTSTSSSTGASVRERSGFGRDRGLRDRVRLREVRPDRDRPHHEASTC